jgi:hypothetical protein
MSFYFDENLPSRLADAIALLQENDPDYPTEVTSIIDRFGRGVSDEDWIPILGEEQATVITHDYQIHRRSDQRKLYKDHGLGLVIIRPPSKSGLLYWEQVQLTIKHWDKILETDQSTKKPYCLVIKQRGSPHLIYNGKNYRDVD